MKPVSVVVPALNERENILSLLLTINKEFNPAEIIVVDDSSPDHTALIVQKNKKVLPNVKLIINNPPLGLTGSIQKGINLADSKCKYIAWMDADFSHPPKILNIMYQKITRADIVVGSWLTKDGGDKRKEKMIVFLSFIINKLCQILFGNTVNAYTSGFIMTRRSIIKDFKLKGDYGEYCIDFLVRNQRMGRKIATVSFNCYSRKFGVSKTAPNLIKFISRGIKYLTIILSLVRKSAKNI